jgi:hypothetical protein
LAVHRLGGLDRLAKRRIAGGHVAPADESHALACDFFGEDAHDFLPPFCIMGHEQRADPVLAGRGQCKAEFGRLLDKKLVRNLNEDARAVAGARIGAHGTAVLEIDQDGQSILDDLMGLRAFDVGDEADAARILVERGVVQPARRRHARVGLRQRPIDAAGLLMGSIVPGVLRGEPCGTHRLVLASLAAQRPAAVPACLPPSWRPPWSEENRSRAGNRPPAVPAFAMWLLVLKVADGPASAAAPPRAIGVDRQLGQQCCPTRRTCQNSATDTRVCHLKICRRQTPCCR